MKTYTDCYNLPFARFIDVIVDRNLQALVISGTATNEQLEPIWEKIYEQYNELTNNSQYNDYNARLKDYGLMKTRLVVLAGAVEVLSIAYRDDVAEALRNVGFRHTLDPMKPDAYIEELNRLSKQCGSLSQRVKMAEKELNDIAEQMEKSKVTRQDFTRGIAAVSHFMGFRVDAEQVTVAEFIEYQNQLMAASRRQLNTKGQK